MTRYNVVMSLERPNFEQKNEIPEPLNEGSKVMLPTEEGVLESGWKIFHVFKEDDEEVKEGKAQEGDFLVIKEIEGKILRKKVSPSRVVKQPN